MSLSNVTERQTFSVRQLYENISLANFHKFEKEVHEVKPVAVNNPT